MDLTDMRVELLIGFYLQDKKTYDYEEWRKADEEYWKNRDEQDDKRSPNKARRG